MTAGGVDRSCLVSKGRVRSRVNGLVLVPVAVLSLMSMACSVFGVRSEREPEYTVLLQEGSKEIRQYSAYLVARTWAEGEYDESSNKAFRVLFDYISGNNVSQRSVAMTAPVSQERAGEPVAMTAPVSQERSAGGWTMTFVMPSSYTMASIPEPVDPSIEIGEVPARKVAVLTYSGFTSPERIDRLGRDLIAWLEAQGYRAVGQPRSARYDPPFTIPSLRRSEVQIDVD